MRSSMRTARVSNLLKGNVYMSDIVCKDSTSQKGCVWISNVDYFSIQRSIFKSNIGGRGCVTIERVKNVSIQSSMFTSNFGSGLSVEGSTVTIANSYFVTYKSYDHMQKNYTLISKIQRDIEI